MAAPGDAARYQTGAGSSACAMQAQHRKPRRERKATTITEGPNKGKTQVGIFKIDGDTWTFCVAEPGVKTRPTDFTADLGSNRMLVTVKKLK